jgi:hypothetical protein
MMVRYSGDAGVVWTRRRETRQPYVGLAASVAPYGSIP